MSSTASSRTSSSLLACAAALDLPAARRGPTALLLPSDEFRAVSRHWHIEAEQPEREPSLRHGVLDIDAPRGRHAVVQARARRVRCASSSKPRRLPQADPNDQVSDLNVFWMASNADGTRPVFARARSGTFAEYNDLLTYYVGLGGNRNTTSRFRRYVGEPGNRPLLPRARPLGRRSAARAQPQAKDHSRCRRRAHRIPARRKGAVRLRRRRAIHARLVRAAHHVQPPAHREPAHPPALDAGRLPQAVVRILVSGGSRVPDT